ncbi:hypothetical protein ACFYNW_06350 [Streptomyces virginiae]|uniref:hypothetical protein n=1 Tax=Streptomyces virginiae TaxID=1961 RepID=UPI0036EEFA79
MGEVVDLSSRGREGVEERFLVPEKSSPLWWLFAAISVVLYLAVMFPGMVNRRQKIWVSCGPVAGFLAIMAFSVN